MATILIVDDHAINRRFLLTLLGYGGHRLLEATEGASALNIVRTELPDLVITDILMPNMDGYELVTHMRAHPSMAKIPVIFYTASYRAREAYSMAEACGVQWVLAKPAEPELILQTVQEALGSAQEKNVSPYLSASIEADKFSAINDQLREYLGELGDGSDQLVQFGSAGEAVSNTGSDAGSAVSTTQRGNLRTIAQKLSGSLGSLQEISMRLTQLIELGLDLAAERDSGRMLEILCRAAHSICGAKYAVATILEDDGKTIGLCFTRGMEISMVSEFRAMLSQAGVLGKMLRERTPIRLNDLKNGAHGNMTPLGLPLSHPPINCFLGIPLCSKERTLGWLYLADKTNLEDFSEVDEQVVATIASQMVAAYENLNLYDEAHQHRAQLQMEMAERRVAQEALRRNLVARTVMAECNRVLVHADNEMALLSEMCLTIVATGGYSLAWIGYVDEAKEETHKETDEGIPRKQGRGEVRLVAQAGLPHIFDNQFSSHWIESKQGRFPAEVAIDTSCPYRTWDQPENPALAQWQALATSHGYRSAFSVPIKEGTRIFGALTIFESEPNRFTTEEIAMLTELAGDIAYGAVSLRTRRAREIAEQNLVAAQEKLTSILSSIDNIVWSLSKNEFLYISPIAEKIFGYPLQAFYENRDLWFECIHPDDQQRVRESMATLREHGTVTREYRILRQDGDLRWLEDRTKAIHDANGKLVRLDGVASDITERKAYEARIEQLATHDPLTNLANRNLLQDRLSQALAMARRSQRLLALLFIDLDRFKDINDSLGHTLGDALLVAVAARLRSVVREGDTVARPGGDEFIVLLPDIGDMETLRIIAEKLLHSFAIPFTLGEIELHVGASIGVSVFPKDGQDIETLLRNTDTAMYRVKEKGGNALQHYSADMSVQAMERMALENGLHHAVERQEFELYYQPKVNLTSGKIIGCEALIRWHHPDLGMILPGRFIKIAEEVGLIPYIGEWVLRTACLQNKAWQNEGLPPISVSVNLSACQFVRDGLVSAVTSTLQHSGLAPQFLELELTEGLVMHNAEIFITKLQELKALGVQLSIDDFGTGYSSLSYLKRFPLDRLKIDQSFIRDISTDDDDAAITLSIISLGHCLNLKIIAEGVETAEQLAFLRAHDCDEMQGYYFSVPLTEKEFSALLREGKILA